MPALPHTWRPFGVRMAGAVLGGGLLVVCVLAWVGFDAETRAQFTVFQRSRDRVGLLAFALWFALVRSRVVAEDERLVVVNGYRRREYEWAEVVAVHLPPGRAVGDPRPGRRHHDLRHGHPGLRRRPGPARGRKPWVVYAKAPFAGPEAVLAYLSRYTHRVAISNRRLIAFDQSHITFRYKDYRRNGTDRQQVMTLAADEFIRRFLLHVLPRGFHRIRHYGLLAGSARKASLARARRLLNAAAPSDDDTFNEPDEFRPSCPCCGGRMIVIETFERWRQPRGPPDASATNRETAP